MGRADNAVERVEELLADGAPFESIEVWIDGQAGLSRESRSALWLLAWAETSTSERRRAVRETISMAERGELGPLAPRRRRGVSVVARR